MSKINEMIKELCPNGVERVKLGEIGKTYTGLSGKSKNDFIDGNALFATFTNVFNNPFLDLNIADTVVVNDRERQNKVMRGDILFTGSSETPDEAGMASVVLEDPKQDLYLNSFCFGLRPFENTNISSSYLAYLLRSPEMRGKISKTAFGVTRFNIKKDLLLAIEIPLPPLPIQQEIVNILDKFSSLIDNLDETIQLRQKQYEYYREKLLTFEDGECEWKTLGEIGTIIRGNGLQKTDFSKEGVGCVHYGQIYTQFGFSINKTLTFVPEELSEKLTKVEPGNLIIACTSENVEDVCKSVVWLGSETIVTGGHACVFKHNENPKYIGYCFLTNNFFNQKQKYAYGAKVIDIKTEKLSLIKIPVPERFRQDEIVGSLDNFESLISNLKLERDLRQKQYEYYREKLLTFE